ncbi:efflux RND transporter permease subunit [uncultured Draconibacterium sp.]|uniref:efflux RND transporter permease subunit n=1 Tax=uncultured Draconibacterium sp. TaxID=1573823 RepID=UPI0029C792F1|nr:efflux RND transporter permease subunit [uncultured Draconibacterium sp.]
MNLTKTAINNNRVVYILLLLVIVMGIVGYNSLPRNSMPPYTVRVASVVTYFAGAGPERVEMLISDKIEKIAQEIPEADYITSTSRTGLSVVNISLKDNVPEAKLQAIWDKLRRKIENIQSDLPSGIYGPLVKDEDIGQVYGIIVGMESDGYSFSEMEEYAEDLRNDIIALDDAAKVELGGVIEERIFIDYNDFELSKYGLSSSQLKNIISATNIIIPSGEVNLGDERIIIEASGNMKSVDEIKNLIIPAGNGESIKLGDITTVKRDYITPKESIVKINGDEGIALYISLKEGANIINLGIEVDKVLAKYNDKLPVGLTVKRIASQDEDVSSNVSSFISNVIQSIIIVLLVMFVFLGVRTGLVVASLIPTSIIATLLFMGFFDVGLNQVSLAALIMALGMLVDNAIVMAESITVKMEQGESAVQAAVSSSKELMIPLLISTLTTSAAFLSFFLAESIMGEIMGQLFVVITIALVSSWILALTIVPLLAVAIIRIKKKDEEHKKTSIFDKLSGYYNKLLQFTLRKSMLSIIVIILLFILSVIGFRFIPVNFMPDSERNLVTLDLDLPLGTNIEATEERVAKITEYIKDKLLVNDVRDKGITDWSSYIGQGPKAYDLGYSQGESNSSYAHMLLNTSSGSDNQMIIDSLENYCFSNIPDGSFTIKRLGSGGGASIPVEIRIFGDDFEDLFKVVSSIKSQLRQIPGTKNVDDNWGPRIKKILVDINQTKLSQTSLTNQDIALSLNTYLTGYDVGVYREDDNSIPIVMKASGNENLTFDDLESLTIFSQSSGKSIPLVQVASIVPEWQYASILRRDLKRTVTVNCQLQEGYTANNITHEIIPWLEEQSNLWPSEIKYELGGESESSSDAMGAVADKLPLSVFIILLLLVIQFNSIRKTSIVLSAIPLGIIGVVMGLLITNAFFSFTAFLGIISLAGIVINNAIVLIDRIDIELQDESRNKIDSLIQACNERFRPILLTTFTTSLGLIPLWLGGGAMWQPMAISIIFGLLFATFITLIFVPILYKSFFKLHK